MDKRISDWIRRYQSSSSTTISHVSCIKPRGRFSLGRKDIDGMFDLLCGLVNDDAEMISGLAEIPQDYAMMVGDIDIKKKVESLVPTRLYTQEQIELIIETYQKHMRTACKDIKPENLICILLEKEPYIQDGYNKSGCHLAFISFFCSKAAQDIYILPNISEEIDELDLFRELGYPKSSAVLDISKKNTKAKPWLMYGSRKSETNSSYKVSKAYAEGAKEIPLAEAFKDYKLYNADEEEMKLDKDISYYYPRVFSVFPFGRSVLEVSSHIYISGDNIYKDEDDDDKKPYENKDNSIEENLKAAEELMTMISPDRAFFQDDWIEMGWILFSIGDGCQKAFDMWLTFSSSCAEKFSESECISRWNKFHKGNYSIRTLKYYASIDNKDEYEAYKKKVTKKHLDASLDASHYDLAKALHEIYSTTFVCAALDPRPLWFQFENHHWQPIEKGVALRDKISTELHTRFTQLGRDLYTELQGKDPESADALTINNKLKQLGKIMIKLKTTSFKSNIMVECAEVFYDKDFLKKLGKNPNLIACLNGVYDLKEFTFRPGKPEDYILLQMPVNYDSLDPLDPWVIELESFFDKVFPDKSVREYFLDCAAEYLIGGNFRKSFQVWSGVGNNSKSITQKMFMDMFGEYAIDVPTTLLTGAKTKAGQACPELARSGNGARIIYAQEPDKKEQFNIGTVKSLSGNDRFFVRNLYSPGGEIDPMFKMILVCNTLPRLDCDDPAIWFRIKVIPFEAYFCKDAPESEEEQFYQKRFPMDTEFSHKIPKLTGPLFWMLIERLKHNKIIEKKIVEPSKVSIATEHYRRTNDFVGQYIDERLTKDSKGMIALAEMFTDFRGWFKNSFPNFQIPTKPELLDYLSSKWGEPAPGLRWKGYRPRTANDDIKDGRALAIASSDLVDYGASDDNKSNVPLL